MKKPEVWKLVLGRLLPAKSDFSRDDWRTYIHRYLLPEIQAETLRFYGENSSAEALQPALDYASPGHRARLQAFPRHNQLFGVFDRLRLTDSEIHALCKWDGTKVAKEHFERQLKVKLRDTTWDGVQPYNKQRPTACLIPMHLTDVSKERAQVNAAYDLGSDYEVEVDDEDMLDSEEEDEESGEESEDELQRSYGVELNQRLMDGTMDADWEQWLKEAIERGVVPDLSHAQAFQNFAHLSSENQATVLHGSGPVPLHTGSNPASTRVSPQPRRTDPTSRVLGSDGAVISSHNPALWAPYSGDANGQAVLRSHASRSPGIHPPGDHQSVQQRLRLPSTAPFPTDSNPQPTLPTSSDINHTISTVQATQPPSSVANRLSSATVLRPPTYWGREIPEIFSDSPRPHVAALQAQLPPPPQYPQYYPSARVITSPAIGVATSAPVATPSASVPS